MSNYTKFDLNTIRQKLKNNEYASLTGAMRAIGKTQQLSEADKEKARNLARKHFGDETPAAAPKAKKTKVKKAAKKVTKKAAKAPRAAKKKKAAKKAEPAPAAAATVAKKTAKKASKRAPRAKAAPAEEATTSSETAAEKAFVQAADARTTEAANSREDVITEMGKVISSVGESLKAMEAAKRMFPKAELERNVEMAAGAIARAVEAIDKEITLPRLGAASAPQPTARKKSAKKGTRAKAAPATPKVSDAPPAPAEETEDLAENEAPPELSDEEKEQLALARQTQATV